MLHYFLSFLTLFALLGCNTATKEPTPKQNQKQMHTMPAKMFQSVNSDQATLVQTGKNKLYCARCGMNLVMFYKTSHTATYEDKEYQYCSIHCLTDHLSEGIELRNPKVVDVVSLKLIPVQNAFYVVGSDVKGTMSRVSKYAFASLKDAQAFQAKHGGKIVDFYAALEVAKKDFR